MRKQLFIIVLALLAWNSNSTARVNTGIPTGTNAISQSGKTEADCSPAAAQVELNINNVRTTLMTGGDMWWDLDQAKYEVPKVPVGSDQPSRHSIFAGALWIGGIDQFNNLKVAAQTYRQSGNDFWPGPLDLDGQIEEETCNEFDRFWEVLGSDIDAFRGELDEAGGVLPVSAIPESILEWPGRNNPHFVAFALPPDKELAPFFDVTGDGIYDPTEGDYPVIDPDIEAVYGDQMIWWMFNDRGNVHTETGGESIGLEVGALAFAFATNDEVNNMTFYKYVVDNRSTQYIDSVYFGQWVDPDLGQYDDDFVGCVPEEGLGFVYNGDAVDGDYGDTPPILGVDFFKGPEKLIGYDDDDQAIYEELGMSAFVYYDNDFSVRGNPENASHFYGYLAGVWKDGTPFTCGGNGYGGTELCDYIFPGEPSNPEEWSECSENNTPFDRRFLQSSGPFRLNPGDINDVIVGVVWLNEGFQYPCPALPPILRADKKAQALFDNNFKLKNGPDAPNIALRELNKEIILSLWNDPTKSNNAFEAYSEPDPILVAQEFPDSVYNFQGYKLYQLRGVTVSSSEYNDPDKARLIATVDIKDGITSLINYTIDADVGSLAGSKMVDATDSGISHTFRIQEDLFATGDKKLINYKKYYYSAIAYSYNAHIPYDPSEPADSAQLEPYLEGRNNIKIYTAIPHSAAPQEGGIVVQSEYGDGPEITQLKGFGSGGLNLELSDATIEDIMSSDNHKADNPVYKGARGPIDVKVYDPLKVPAHKFKLELTNYVADQRILADSSKWKLTDVTSGEVYNAESIIKRSNQQSIGGWEGNSLGFTVNIEQQAIPSGTTDAVIDSELAFSPAQSRWLSLIPDQDGTTPFNWIRSGTLPGDEPVWRDNRDGGDDYYDPNQYYETILEGRFAPYCLTNNNQGPRQLAPACTDCTGASESNSPNNTLNDLASVDVVITSDKSLWTQCVVVETGPDAIITEGKAGKNSIRHHSSWDKDSNTYAAETGNSIEAGNSYFIQGTSASSVTYTNDAGEDVQITANQFFSPEDISGSVTISKNNGATLFNAQDVGRSWFPGYAINVETGERLNMMFGENSFLGAENGRDMIWNPTSNAFGTSFNFLFGGQHYVYVMKSRYDKGAAYHSKLVEYALSDDDTNLKEEVYDEAMWVTIPLLTPGFELKSPEDGLVPNRVDIKVRIANPYQQENDDQTVLEYEFDFSDQAAKLGSTEVAEDAMDDIKVVPNPYYAFSDYETSQLDNRVRIINLPARATISIFTLEGTLIKTIGVDNIGTDTAAGGEAGQENINSVDWDVKNNKGVPIASGVYLIHVDAPELGEARTIKWFCIARPIDLDVF